MNYTICSECCMPYRKINADRHNLCPACKRKEDGDYKKVIEYISLNPETDLKAIHNATGVSVLTIQKWIIGRKLTIKGNLGLSTCRRCSVPILEGKICDSCKSKLLIEYINVMPVKFNHFETSR